MGEVSAAKAERLCIRTGDVGDLREIGDGGRDAHVDDEGVIRDEAVPRSILAGEIELLPQEARHVGIA